jgi:two-component system, NarL family, sensor histidine kinase BarA
VSNPEPRSLDELTMGGGVKLEELVDRAGLGELVGSFFRLFRVSIRIISESTGLLCEAWTQPKVYEYLGKFPGGVERLNTTITDLKSAGTGEDGESAYECFSGAHYYILAVEYDGRRIGRLVIGPYLPPEVKTAPDSLVLADPGLDGKTAKDLLAELPRVRRETVREIGKHLRASLELILFSGHKALLTTNMHLASVHQSFRELEEKNHKLQDAYDRLKELDRLKSNFLATVSHELRTPLTSIIGYSEMLTEGLAGDLSEEQKEFVSTIHGKGEQLLELITGLLDLTKMESGTLSMTKEQVDVSELLRDLVVTMKPSAMKKHVDITETAEAGLPLILGDPTRLNQVLINLAGNALKFTPEGGTIGVSARAVFEAPSASDDDDGDAMMLFTSPIAMLELRVADSGIGIPDAEKTKVFDAFYQIDSSSTRQAGGTGLGLSIVRRIVDAHGGKIRIEDNQPTGAVIVVTLPVRRASTG